MGGWKTSAGCVLVAAASLFLHASNAPQSDVGNLRQLVGSEVYIDQPPKKALEKDDSGSARDEDKKTLKPAEGPMPSTPGRPTTCEQQNTPSQACYTATQQARPIPR